MSIKRRFLTIVTGVAVIVIAMVTVTLNIRANLSTYAELRLPPADGGIESSPVRATFLGVSTLLFEDGETSIMTDGFFSRPGLFDVATKIAPDTAVITAVLARSGATALAAVIPVHSHYDHAMDAPLVAKYSGAVLVGSASTANVGRGAGLSEDRIRVAVPGEVMTFGKFRVTLIASEHVPSPFLMPGEIAAPLSPPARTKDYRLGGCYSVVIEHEGRTILVQGSAGFVPGALTHVKAEVVYLGVATLGKQAADHRDGLWREVVTATGARRVFAIHWDDFMRPLNKPLVPMPRLMDDFDETMRFLKSKAGEGGTDLRVPMEFAKVDPFAGLRPVP